MKNTQMLRNVLTSIGDRNIRSLVFLSAADVYGMEKRESAITEQSSTRPESYYGLSKLACESLLRLDQQRRWPATILRLPGVYGLGDNGRSIVGRLLLALHRGESLTITGSGATKRDYVFVDDVCRVVDVFLKNPVEDTANVATGNSTSINEYIKLIAKSLKVAPTIQHTAADPSREFDLHFDPAKLRQLLPDIEFTSPADGIAAYAASLTEQDA